MNSHQIVDLVVLAVLLYCAVKGASRGLLSQLAWVVALLLCFKFSGAIAPAIEPMIGVAPPLKQWIAMLLVYVLLCGVSFVAAGMLSSWMEKARVIDFDKHLGGVLGFVKGVVICMTGMFFAITMSEPMRQIVSKTYSGYAAAVILNNSQYLIPLLPEHTVATVRNVIDEFNRRLQPGIDDLNGATPSNPDDFGYDSFVGSGDRTDRPGIDLSQLLPSGTSGNTSQDSRASDGASLQDLLSQLPTQLRRQLTQQAMDQLQNSSPAARDRLLDQLTDTVPDDAGTVLSDFFRSSRDSSGGQGTTSSPPLSQQPSSSQPSLSQSLAQLGPAETTLLNEIAGIYSQRNDIAVNTRRYLAGVPASVQRRVLEDWHADAMGINGDPDPTTNINTRLDERIVRQLSKAGISLDRLDRDLRIRLSDVVNGYRN